MARKILTDLDVQSNKITNLGAPSAGTDAATRAYVDGAAGSLVAAFTIPGTLTVAVGSVRWYAPKAITISSVVVSVGTAPQGAAAIFNVRKSGATIFGSRPTIAASANNGSTTGLSVALTTSDYITVDIDQIGTTFAGSDAVVQVIYS